MALANIANLSTPTKSPGSRYTRRISKRAIDSPLSHMERKEPMPSLGYTL